MNALPALPRHQRSLIGAGLCAIAALAWAYTIYESRRMHATGVFDCLRMKMSGPDLSAWPVAALLPLFCMWAIMMVAMMLPSAFPMILTFASVTRNRQRMGRPYVSTLIFVLGYVTIWSAFSTFAALTQWWLHRHALLSASMSSSSVWLGSALLLAAGVFQFTPFKQSCLARCRGPLEFITTRWREGIRGAFWMGLEHGAFCTGCCWALMALLFVAGVMNILWIAVITVLVCLEKILPARVPISAVSGLFLVTWGACLLVAHVAFAAP